MPLGRRSFVSAAAGGLCAQIAGCRKAGRKVIGVVPKGVASIFFQGVRAGVEAAGRHLNADVIWNGPAEETEFTRQIHIVESMISGRVDAILISPGEKTALVGVIERAMSQGIPVVVFDSAVDTKNYTCYIATDNQGAGEVAAGEVARLTGGSGEVALLRHIPGSASTGDRERGFTGTVAGKHSGLKLIAEGYSMGDRARALRIAEDFLTAHPNLKAIFAPSEVSTTGAERALRARSLAGRVHLVGFDASPPLVTAVRDRVISALLIQDPFRIGWLGVKALLEKLNGGTPPPRVEIPAQLVTAENVDSPAIQEMIDITRPRVIEGA
jgi:ribose transport system substrate-binding protein